jgi:hypothetical protein
MSEFRELSRLPEDPEYWESLQARVMSGLPERSPLGAAPRWWAPLADRAWGLGGLAAAAALAALLLVPDRPTPDGLALLSLPAEAPEVRALVSAPAPPSIASLMLTSRSAP